MQGSFSKDLGFVTFNKLLKQFRKRLILNAIMKSQFSYCSLVRIFCSRQTNHMINKLHERALRIVLHDHISNFETLLQKSNEIFSHHRNIQTLMIELYNIKNELAPPIMNSRLNKRNDILEISEILNYGHFCFPGLFKQRNIISFYNSDIGKRYNECPKFVQSVCTKPSIYQIYGSFLGTYYDLNCNCFQHFYLYFMPNDTNGRT